MPRSSPGSSPPKIHADAMLLEFDLTSWAGKHIARRGRQDALLGRVEFLCLAPDGCSIDARVRGNRPLPYTVRVSVDLPGLACSCTCARETRPACKHAIAALEALRFPLSASRPREGTGSRRRRTGGGRGRGRIVRPARGVTGYLLLGGAEKVLTRDERIEAAGREEILARRHRARRERARVSLLDDPDAPPILEVAGKAADPPGRVTLRGPDADLFSCTCADFADSELQSCRHVERVMRCAARRKIRARTDLLSVWWRPRSWIDRVPNPLREIRVDSPLAGQASTLDEFFDAQGWLVPAPDGADGRWATRAVTTARRVARRHGFVWDLDARVEDCLRVAAAREELGARLATIDDAGGSWREILSGIGFRLHPYQEEGALFLARRGRALLADDMGLGKTVQAIVAALLLRRHDDAGKALVVCPASLKYQWRREIERACGERARVVEGPPAGRQRIYREWSGGFLILNYELVLRDLAQIREASPDLVVLDEAQRIKNWGTKTARAVKQLDSRYAFILTGTPLENRLLELHSLVEYLHPRALGPRWRLLPFHAVTESHGRVVAYEGLDVLRGRLKEFFIRRERAAVLDQLPERTDNTFWTGMTPAQRRPYRRHATTVATIASRRPPLRPADVRTLLQALTRMRILCNALAQYDWSEFEQRLRDPTPPTQGELKGLGSPKLEEFARVLEDLLDEHDEKIVVFSQWERMLRLADFTVRDLLERRDQRAEIFHGGLNSRARGEMLEGFRLDPEFRLLFSTDAGGLGLNLQESASIVINLEVPWNPAILEQRVGRVHRIGQRRSVRVLHFVTRGAIEERVRHVLENKRALFDGLLIEEADRIVFDDEDDRTTWFRKICELVE